MLRFGNVVVLFLALACFGESASARYIQSDPVGLEGGFNTYAYVGNNPLRYVDPKGLLTKCKSGLNVLGGKQVGALHHEFSCFKTDDGKMVCRGFGRDPESSVEDAVVNQVSGSVLKDGENYSSDTTCEPDDNNKCMDKCAADLYAGIRQSLNKDALPVSLQGICKSR